MRYQASLAGLLLSYRSGSQSGLCSSRLLPFIYSCESSRRSGGHDNQPRKSRPINHLPSPCSPMI